MLRRDGSAVLIWARPTVYALLTIEYALPKLDSATARGMCVGEPAGVLSPVRAPEVGASGSALAFAFLNVLEAKFFASANRCSIDIDMHPLFLDEDSAFSNSSRDPIRKLLLKAECCCLAEFAGSASIVLMSLSLVPSSWIDSDKPFLICS